MAQEEDTLADRWLRRIKNNPVVAALIVMGALIAIVSPIWTSVRGLGLSAPANERSGPRVETLEADRDTILVPVLNALTENKDLYDLLSSPLYHEPGWGIQESYYERVRRDGPDQHEGMQRQIDSLVQNNRKIMTSLDSYTGRARTPAIKEQERQFRRHAKLYEARWAGMKAAAVAGEPRPIAEPVFPKDFPASVQAELTAVEKLIAERSGG